MNLSRFLQMPQPPISSTPKVNESIESTQDKNITNKGTGAGGANTNKNGLPYEEMTDLKTEYTVIDTTPNSQIIAFNQDTSHKFITTKQAKLFKSMRQHIDASISKAHGCKNPDECFINYKSKIMFIVEKKFQQCSGSVCEKIQTPDFKIWQYSRTFPEFQIVYIYCLSEWFKENCPAELEYLEYKKIPVFWGNSPTYKKDIINYMLTYNEDIDEQLTQEVINL